jgi:hypothetical protein
MNILLLTPERTGNTLLHRLLTIYMTRKSFDRPVINIHELVNGLEKYHNPAFNQEILKKTQSRKRDSLTYIENQIKTAGHYVTVNLAEYHIAQRQDSLEEQLSFYDFLNENFYIIGCRRDNLFEYAISGILKTFSHYGNTFYPLDKVVRYRDYYNHPITIDRLALEKFLNRYKAHISWSEKYFDVQRYFDYDKHISDIENFILTLDFMKNHVSNTWKDMFDISWKDWDACHRLVPNLALHTREEDSTAKKIVLNSTHLAIETTVTDILNVKLQCNTINNYYPAETIIQQIGSISITENEYNFLSKNLNKYKNVLAEIEKLISLGILSEGVPMKLQSLGEKKKIIKNFDQCLEWYNEWTIANKFGKEYTSDELTKTAMAEETRLMAPLAYRLTN